MHCKRGCRCDEKCRSTNLCTASCHSTIPLGKLRWKGCRCPNAEDCKNSDKCICKKSNRECDPELCGPHKTRKWAFCAFSIQNTNVHAGRVCWGTCFLYCVNKYNLAGRLHTGKCTNTAMQQRNFPVSAWVPWKSLAEFFQFPSSWLSRVDSLGRAHSLQRTSTSTQLLEVSTTNELT